LAFAIRFTRSYWLWFFMSLSLLDGQALDCACPVVVDYSLSFLPSAKVLTFVRTCCIVQSPKSQACSWSKQSVGACSRLPWALSAFTSLPTSSKTRRSSFRASFFLPLLIPSEIAYILSRHLAITTLICFVALERLVLASSGSACSLI